MQNIWSYMSGWRKSEREREKGAGKRLQKISWMKRFRFKTWKAADDGGIEGGNEALCTMYYVCVCIFVGVGIRIDRFY